MLRRGADALLSRGAWPLPQGARTAGVVDIDGAARLARYADTTGVAFGRLRVGGPCQGPCLIHV